MYLGYTSKVWPVDNPSPRVTSNFLAAPGRRLLWIGAIRGNRVRDRPEAGIHLGQGVLNPC
jgi:hypothetical protein